MRPGAPRHPVRAAAVRIHELDDHASPGCEEVWEVFVRATPEATFFHLPAWRKVIREAFGHTTHYVYAEQDGAITGVLPLARMRTRLFGDALISTPFCVYGGPVSVTPEAARALEEYALALMRRTGVPLLEFRRRDAADPGWPERPALHYTFRRAITGDAAADMLAIPRKQRAMVRKGIQNGLTSISNSDTRALHGVYAEMVHALGTPVFPERYFRLLAEAFPQAHDVTTVLHEGKAVASVLNFHFREEVLPYYGGGGRAARGLAANDFLYWEVMRRAGAERGARLFDFGRSKKDTGAFDFKRNWGFTPEPLHYCYQLREGATLPENNPSNPKYQLMIKAWRRLPIRLANRIGPYIVRGLG
jgi:FemAB-related protein (PEP-CTERM system-associated)